MIGTSASRNQGVEAEMSKMVDRTLKRHLSKVRNDSGIPLSVASTSLLKRFMIRPDGVESKNSIVLLRIEASIRLCRLFAPFKSNARKNTSETR